MTSLSPAFTVAMALAAGMVCQVVARHLRVPGLVLLLAAGVLLGPEVAGVLNPDSLGDALHLLVGMAVAVILFEGGLNLNLGQLRRQATPIRRLVTVGALVTAAGGTLAARLLMGWSWELSVLLGTLVIVTGPTVTTPIVRRIGLEPRLRTILEGEGLLIDPVGAVVAVVALEFVLAAAAAPHAGSAFPLLGLPSRLGTGLLLGVVGGLLIGLLLRREHAVPSGMENVFTLSLVLLLFEVSEAVLPESGIMTAAVAGIVVGNMGVEVEQELKEFKEQLTVLLIGLLFVLLAATVELEAALNLGWPGVATVAALMLIVRPANVAVSTWGTDLGLRERLFLSWLAPRGIVAAAIASVFAQTLSTEGMPGGEALQALVFVVIAVTVVVQGGTARWVAAGLGVRQAEPRGWVVVGANPLGRMMARVLGTAGEALTLIDSSGPEVQEAEREGLPVVYGNAVDDRSLRQAGLPGRMGLAAVTPNQAVNLLIVREVLERYDVPRAAVALDRRQSGVDPHQVHAAGGGVLFGRFVDLEHWRHALRRGRVDVALWEYTDQEEEGARLHREPGRAALEGGRRRGASAEEPRFLALVLEREDGARPVTDGDLFRSGDRVYFLWTYGEGDRAGRWLRDRGWKPAEF